MANASRAGNAVRIAPARHNEPLEPAAFADDESSIRREGGPAFRHSFNLGSFCRREKRFQFLGEILKDRPIRLDRRRRFCNLIASRVAHERFWFPSAEQQSMISDSAIKRQ